MEGRQQDGEDVFSSVAARSDLAVELLRASQACVKLMDLSGRLEGVSAHGLKLLEIDDFASVCGLDWVELWPPEDRERIRKAVEDAREGRSTQFVARCPTAKGALRWWSVAVAPVRSDDGAIVRILSSSYDITHLKEREAELERAVEEGRRLSISLAEQLEAENRRLAEAQRRVGHAEKLRLLGGFVGHVVHDINNVLQVMQSAGRAMRRQTLEPRIAGMLDEVDKAIDRGHRLVRRLLDFARSEDAEAEVFSPGDLIARDADLMRHLAGPGARVTVDLADDVWPILAEQSRLQSVLFNLVSNARDALGDSGAIRIAALNCWANARPQGLALGDYVVVSVADDGLGMSREALDNAGVPFFTTKGPGKGTGLGLASAFEFAASCNGRAYVESAPGVGTSVSLYLARAGALGDADSAPDAAIDPGLHGRATLLVVENEPAALKHLASALRALGYVVLEASSEALALAVALSGVSIDLVISDLKLGAVGGVSFAERLRENRPDLPAIYLADSAGAGAGAPKGEIVVRKPVSARTLAQAVLKRLGRLPALALREEAGRRSDRVREKIRSADVRSLFDAWRAASARLGRLPGRKDIDIDGGPGDSRFVVAVGGRRDLPMFRFVEVGAALERRLGRKLEGEAVAAEDEEALGSFTRAYARCLYGVAHFDYARLTTPGGGVMLFERLILPLSEDGLRVTHLLGVATFDEIGPTIGARP